MSAQERQGIGETRFLVASSAVGAGGMVSRGLALNGRHKTDKNLGHTQVLTDLWPTYRVDV